MRGNPWTVAVGQRWVTVTTMPDENRGGNAGGARSVSVRGRPPSLGEVRQRGEVEGGGSIPGSREAGEGPRAGAPQGPPRGPLLSHARRPTVTTQTAPSRWVG